MFNMFEINILNQFINLACVTAWSFLSTEQILKLESRLHGLLFLCRFKAERASYVSNVWKAEKQLVRMWKLWGFPWPAVKNLSGMYTVGLRDIVQQLTWQEVHRHNLERGVSFVWVWGPESFGPEYYALDGK